MSEGIGAAVKRKEDKRFITGRGKYTDDIRMENQAYGAFVRSPHAHAEVEEVARADRPPHVQVLGEEARGDHPHPVVHEADCRELTHTGVDDGPDHPIVERPAGRIIPAA